MTTLKKVIKRKFFWVDQDGKEHKLDDYKGKS
jgi:hypothetical protein